MIIPQDVEYLPNRSKFIKVTMAGGGKKVMLIRIKDIESVEPATTNPEWTAINFYDKERTGLAVEESLDQLFMQL